MKRKRFIKIGMSQGMDRNEAAFAAKLLVKAYGSYAEAYDRCGGYISWRCECYMPGYVKRQEKRLKKRLKKIY